MKSVDSVHHLPITSARPNTRNNRCTQRHNSQGRLRILTSREVEMIERERCLIKLCFIGSVISRRCTLYSAQEGESRHYKTEDSRQMHGCKLCTQRLYR